MACLAVATAVALATFVLLLLNGRTLDTRDSLPYRYLPTALWRDHTFRLDAFPELAAPGNYSIVRDRQGHLISKKPALPVVLVIPPFLAYLALHGHAPATEYPLMLMVKLGGSLGAALAAGATVFLLGAAGLRRRWLAPAGALGMVFLTPFWFTAMDCWPHPLLAFLNALSLYLLLSRPGRAGAWFWIGLLQGLAIAARLGAAAVSVVFLFSAFLDYDRRLHRPLPSPASLPSPKRLAFLFAGLAGPLLLLGWYNAHYFGNPLSQGFGAQAASRIQSPLPGLAGFLFSPAKGLLIFSPVMILALWAFAGGAWRRPAVLFCAAAIAVHMIFWASYADWLGGWGWGPRYLADVAPFGVLLAATGLEHLLDASRRRRFVRSVVGLLAAVSLLFQAAGFFMWDGDYYRRYDAGFQGAGRHWVWRVPPEPLWLLDRRLWYPPWDVLLDRQHHTADALTFPSIIP